MRVRATEDHLIFNGDEREGEFCKHYPHACMELRGVYAIEDSMLSIFVTDVPEGLTMKKVEEMFHSIVEESKNLGE